MLESRQLDAIFDRIVAERQGLDLYSAARYSALAAITSGEAGGEGGRLGTPVATAAGLVAGGIGDELCLEVSGPGGGMKLQRNNSHTVDGVAWTGEHRNCNDA